MEMKSGNIFLVAVCMLQIISSLVGKQHIQCPSKCTCSLFAKGTKIKTDCQSRNLVRIPLGIDKNTSNLLLNNNDIHDIPAYSFQGLYKLQVLTLNNCNISRIDIQAFADGPRATDLSFADNNLSVTELREQLICALTCSSVKIHVLALKNNFEHLPEDMLVCPKPTHPACSGDLQVSTLNLNKNRISNVAVSTFTGISQLTLIHLQDNKLVQINGAVFCLASSNTLQGIFLGHNYLARIPDFCALDIQNMCQLPFTLTQLGLENNKLWSIGRDEIYCLQELEILYFHENNIQVIESKTFESLTKLKKLFLNKNRLTELEPQAFLSSSLQMLMLIKLRTSLSFKHIHMLSNTTTLTSVDLTMTTITLEFQYSTAPNGFHNFFRNLTHLKELRLAKCSLFTLPVDVFADLYNLLTLKLAGNKLRAIDKQILYPLKKLRYLDLSNNQIPVVSYHLLPSFLWYQLKTIGLQYLPYSCTCDMVWFLNFLKNTTVLLNFQIKYRYLCTTPPERKGTYIKDVYLSLSDCYTSEGDPVVILLVVFCVTFIVTALMSSVGYRRRWDIRYVVYRARVWYRQVAQDDMGNVYEFDVFVSYNSEDRAWLDDKLLPRVEDEWHLKCCVHQRDFSPGRNIMENIAEKMGRSRKVFLLVTNNFQSSSWCQTEMALAHDRIFLRDTEDLIVIKLEEILESFVTPRLALLQKTITFLEWPENVKGQELFWNRLKMSIDLPGRKVTSEVCHL